MDLTLIILVLAIIIVGIWFKNFKSVVYFIGIIEIFFRLTHKIVNLLNIKEITHFINKYIPESIEQIVNNYSSGLLNTVLIWILILLISYFEFYLITNWLKRKK